MGKNPTEQFIKENMINQNGTLVTYLKDQKGRAQQIVNGKEASSKSLGLWLQYGLARRDSLLFHQGYQLLTHEFMDEEGFIYGKLGPYGNKIVYTNSLIDDLRITDCLFKAADLWNEPQYEATALTISKYINTHNKRENLLADFYEKNTDEKSIFITLSSIDPLALKEMKAHGVIDLKTYICMVDLLDHIPRQNGFYAKAYNLQEKKFIYDSNINMIDQALIALHQAEEGAPPNSFFSFIKKEFEQKGAIFGIYKLDSKLPAVYYESPALYGVSILYCLQIGKEKFAQSLYERMAQFRENSPLSTFYGSYSVQSNDKTHIFDNLMPLLAEEELIHALSFHK